MSCFNVALCFDFRSVTFYTFFLKMKLISTRLLSIMCLLIGRNFMLRNNGIRNIIRLPTSLVSMSWNFMLLRRRFEIRNSFFSFEWESMEEELLCWHSISARCNRTSMRFKLRQRVSPTREKRSKEIKQRHIPVDCNLCNVLCKKPTAVWIECHRGLHCAGFPASIVTVTYPSTLLNVRFITCI